VNETPPRFYVQRSQTDSTFGPPQGWETVIVTFDRDTAEAYVESFERAMLFEQGTDVSELVSTIARVVTRAELLAEGGEEALAAAEAATRVQYEQRLNEWRDSQG
jgi:hypothetical protein